jgi:hypothetical protein
LQEENVHWRQKKTGASSLSKFKFELAGNGNQRLVLEWWTGTHWVQPSRWFQGTEQAASLYPTCAMFAWLISQQYFSLTTNKPPATSTFLSQQISISHQPNEHAVETQGIN